MGSAEADGTLSCSLRLERHFVHVPNRKSRTAFKLLSLLDAKIRDVRVGCASTRQSEAFVVPEESVPPRLMGCGHSWLTLPGRTFSDA